MGAIGPYQWLKLLLPPPKKRLDVYVASLQARPRAVRPSSKGDIAK